MSNLLKIPTIIKILFKIVSTKVENNGLNVKFVRTGKNNENLV